MYEESNQPMNIYPLLVGVGKSPTAELYVTDLLAVVTLPPFALNVKVYVLAFHCAFNVRVLFVIPYCPFTYFHFPVQLVQLTFVGSYQPLKV